MLYKIVGAVCNVTGMKPAVKTVFLHLSAYTDKPDGSGIFPGAALLAAQTGYGVRTIERSLEWLESEGWIKPETYRKQRVKGWRICIEKLGLTPDEASGKQKKKGEPQLHPPAPPDEASPADTAWQPPGALSAKERLEQKAAARRRAEQAAGVPSL